MKIIAQSPSRISLFGGGTDIASYAQEYGGKIISMAINLRQHIELFTDKDIFGVDNNLFPPNADPALFYHIFTCYGIGSMHHVKVRSKFDGIVGAGLGSSGAAAVALIGAIKKSKGEVIDRDMVAKEAWDIEVNQLGWYGGKQDQFAAVYGGMNLIEIEKETKVQPIEKEKAEKLLSWMVLFYIGGTRSSAKIQKGFETLTQARKEVLDKIKYSVIIARVWIEQGYMKGVAQLLDDTWQLKKKSNKGVTTPVIDELYAYAKQHGALGGKITGAGGCGYMVFMVEPEKRVEFINKMKEKEIEEIDFSIDYNGLDVRIL